MQHLVQGNALKIQVAYLVVGTPNDGNILTCDVVAMTEFTRFLSMIVDSLVISASECSLVLVSLGHRTGSCGSTSVMKVGSCVTILVPMCCVSFLERLVLPMVGVRYQCFTLL